MGDEPSSFEEWGTTAVEPTVGHEAVRADGLPRRTALAGLASILCAAVIALLAVNLGGSSTPAAAAAAQTPMQLLHTAFGDAAARSSVHESESVTTAKSAITFSDDVGAGDGTQDIHIAGEGETRVVVLDGTAYFVGESQSVLIHYFGFSSKLAAQLRGRWISVPHSNSAYATVASDATFSSAISTLLPPANAVLTEIGASKLNGTTVIGIRAQLPAGNTAASNTATFYVSDSNSPLPVQIDITNPANAKDHGTIELSRWAEPLSIKPPPNPVPITSFTR
jgi:hypothetical protein